MSDKMLFDILRHKYIYNFEEVEKALSTRNEEFDLSLFKDLDEKRRNLLGEVEALKAEQNATSKLIPQ